MSTESGAEIIQTATVGIFSPWLEQILLVYNAKLDGLVPPGGKFNLWRDRNILDTALRETREETWLVLFHGSGVFLDERGAQVDTPVIIWEKDFIFPDGKRGHDALFFFQLHDIPEFALKAGAHWLTKAQYSLERREIDGKMHEFRALDVRKRVLAIMR